VASITQNGFRSSFKAALLLLAIAQASLAGDTPVIHIRNFGQVNEHIYRGGEPTEQGLRELAAIHVTLDVDLREPSEGAESERRLAEGLGMQYVNVPMRGMTAPSVDQVKRVLGLLVPDDAGKIFVHCRRGKDRTGTIVACYRVQHDGWDTRKAQQEANSYGMSWTERGMRSFVLKFKPLDLPVAKAAQ
jgi:tyrosine-protein phosphatase SIW14